jgi:hypothetical protein
MGGPGPLRQFIDLAAPQHPTLVDETHLLDARFGVTNIPQNIWIDETGTIVRPAEPGSPAPVYVETDDPTYAVVMQYMHERHPDPGWYSDRIRDWVSKGADSEYAMRPDEVIKASQPRTPDVSRAAAHFELGQHLWHTEGLRLASRRLPRPRGVLPAGARTGRGDDVAVRVRFRQGHGRARHHVLKRRVSALRPPVGPWERRGTGCCDRS